MANSRTAKSIKNSFVSLSFYFVNLVVSFISRKIFLDYLGAEILGLNTTAQSILQFLNLAELGIGSAVGYFLYKPLRENDIDSINEIVTLQGILYKRIASIIIICSIVILPFFPVFFKKIDLPLWYAYASFGAFLFSSLLGYFVNYRQIVLTANQQNYKVQYSYQSITVLRYLAQIYVVSQLEHPFIWWLIVLIVFSLIGSWSLHLMTKKTFPFLKHSGHTYKDLKLKYPDFSTKIKQLFFHKIGGFVLTQSSTLIIYAYANLTLVAYYGNYMMIITGVSLLISALFNSVDAGIGNLVAEGNRSKIQTVFKEMFSLRFAISMIVCFGVYYLTPLFIQLWIGEEYLLPSSTLALMTAILYIGIFRYAVDSFISAFGLFSDVGSPIIEATLNIGLSILLGYYYGLNGILTGVLFSLIIVICCWKPYFLFCRGLHVSIINFIRLYLKDIIVGICAWVMTVWLINHISLTIHNSVIHFIVKAIIIELIFSIILCSGLILTKSGLELFIKRFIR
ncbi:MAG: sugar transporter [Bacteroides sp.]|nr:sugar transporter [Bacteroides sp.]